MKLHSCKQEHMCSYMKLYLREWKFVCECPLLTQVELRSRAQAHFTCVQSSTCTSRGCTHPLLTLMELCMHICTCHSHAPPCIRLGHQDRKLGTVGLVYCFLFNYLSSINSCLSDYSLLFVDPFEWYANMFYFYVFIVTIFIPYIIDDNFFFFLGY